MLAIQWSLVILALVVLVESGTVTVSVTDGTSRHVHSPGSTFQVMVSVSCSGSCGNIRGEWRDFQNNVISSTLYFPLGLTTIYSPSSAIGSYDLYVYSTSGSGDVINGRPAGQNQFGFAILPNQPAVTSRTWNPSVQFGMVLADIDDPWLLNCWVKTLTWDTTGSQWWAGEMDLRRARGHGEVPLIMNAPWSTDDVPAIKAKIKPFMQADLTTIYWELGLEENLGSAFGSSGYFQTLANKAQACRDAANEVGLYNAKFGYQIVETTYSNQFVQFFTSPAASKFDIVSIHPYRWNNFETPETWLETFLVNLRNAMDNYGYTNMKIWITEVGAPINTNPNGHFGYPPQYNYGNIAGITRQRSADYSTKIHVIALHNFVEKVFWYTHKDRGTDYTYAEDNFGTVDYWGFPKPTYAAQFNMYSKLSYGSAGFSQKNAGSNGNVWTYSFVFSNQIVLVSWLYPSGVQSIPLSTIYPGLTSSRVVSITNNVGTPITLSGSSVTLSSSPVFITITPASSSCTGVTCNNGGSCSGGVCNCLFPYTGSSCSSCSCVHGTCSTGQCNCASGYTGTLCDTPTSGSGSSLVLYDDALNTQWSVYNQRSVVNYQATGAWSGSYCLSVKNTGGWGNLPFDYSTTLNLSPYTHLHVAARSNVAATLDLTAFATWGDGDHTYTSISCTTSWQEFFIPLSDFDANGKSIVTIFFVENLAATNHIFYLDSIKLVNLSPVVVYDNAVSSSWAVYNQRSIVNPSATPAWTGTYSISMQNTGGWGNLPFDYSAGLSTVGYTHIRFAARSSVNGAALEMAAFYSWGSGSFPYAHIACSTSWKQFTVPLRDLDADDTTIVTIFFVEDSPASSRTFFVDQLEVISLAPRVMYTDALASGLSVYNQRSVVNYQATGAWEGRYCLSVKNTGGWGNLPFDFSSTFSTRGYTHLHLAAKSNTNGAVLDVAAFMSWGNGDHTYKSIVCSTSWQEFYIPLSDFNAFDTSINTLFFVENLAATNHLFYLDRIEFVFV